MKAEYLIDNLKELEKKEGITLVCCFSRKFFVPIFFKALAEMDLPRKDIHLLVYDNTHDGGLQKALEEALQNVTECYKSVRLYKSNLLPRWRVAGQGVLKFSDSKVSNIWKMWKQLKKLIHTPTFFQLEDDTIAPPHAFKYLTSILTAKPKAAYVTGISTGRHVIATHPVKLGVYHLKMAPCKNCFKVLERRALHPDTKGVVPVDASGVYCFAARTDRFFSGFKGFNPDKLNFPYFFLDVLFTWNMKRQGHEIYADFDVWVSHLHAAGSRLNAFSKDQAVEKADLWLPEYDNYAIGIEVNPDDRKRELKPAESWEI